MAPACVSACPEGAIQVEIVDIEQWRRDYVTANAPGLPAADDSISTTRITLPENLSPDTGRVDTQRIVPEEPHWPLVFMLVLTQLSVGAFAALWALQWDKLQLVQSKLAALALAGAGLAMASLHLGRPIYAWRALKGLRRSWLSREVLSLSIFAGLAGLYVAGLPVALATVVAGCAGVLCSARIYMVAARPAWNSRYTLLDFFSTSLLLGPMLVLSLEAHGLDPSARIWLTRAGSAGAACQLLTQALRFLWLARSEQFELRASALLLSGRLRRAFLIRLALLIAGLTSLSMSYPSGTSFSLSYPLAFALALLSEWMGRWLFFVSVVPKNIAAAFTRSGRAA
jgi:formate dehydrogenase iron-sulfur subunit